MKPLISIIIPVYNVEEYLRQCLDSVINQTYKNLQIIAVNDCSTDSSLQILEEYAQKDQRMVVISNKENLGLGLTRNEGLKIAKGDFIHFLDSDDWLELNAYETLTKYLDKDIDAVRFRYSKYHNNTGKKELLPYPERLLFGTKVNFYDYPEFYKYWSSSVWIKIFRYDFLVNNNLLFNDHRCMEDVEYSMRAAIKARNIIFIDDILLNYRAGRKFSLISKRLYYVDLVAEDVHFANEMTKKLPKDLRNAILNVSYLMLYQNALDSFYHNILPFEDMKRMFEENINLDLLEIPYARKKVLKVLTYNKYKFFFWYCLRRFLKENFPIFTKIYFKVKKTLSGTT